MRAIPYLSLMCSLCSGCAAANDEDVGRLGGSEASSTAANPTPTTPSTAAPTASSTSAAPPRVPLVHRATREDCDAVRPAANEGRPEADPALNCGTDADCAEGVRGRCEDFRGSAMCTYDECTADAECTNGGPCGCELAFWSDANTCLAGNCQVDADCGGEGYCSPSMGDCGSYAGVIGYWCHTPEDACTDDADCADPEQGAGYCAYSPETSSWSCSYSNCVG
jgi:hypothetical protein